MKNKLILIVVLLAIAALVVVFVTKKGDQTQQTDDNTIATGDPLDVVLPFFNAWFEAVNSTSTDPYQAGLANDPHLTTEVQEYIASKQADMGTLDPVLCQLSTPPRVGAKAVFQVENKAQFMILPRGLDVPVPERAVVDVEGVNGEWKITKIDCVSGESAPESEFSFEKRGYLLKNNEPPLDPDTWYLVFEENGSDGHIAPLFFSETSTCVSPDGTETVCDPNQFTNPSQATVKGGMSEVGVEVNRVEFVD